MVILPVDQVVSNTRNYRLVSIKCEGCNNPELYCMSKYAILTEDCSQYFKGKIW